MFEFMWCWMMVKNLRICTCYWISSLDIDYVSHFLKKNLRGMMIRCKKQRHVSFRVRRGSTQGATVSTENSWIPSKFRVSGVQSKNHWLKILARYTIQYIGDYHRPWVLMEYHGLSWIMIQLWWIIKQPMDWDCLQLPLLKRLWIHYV